MGWVSLLEDTLEKIQDNIRLAEDALNEEENFVEQHRHTSIKALNDAQAILVLAWSHLELATSPELDLAHEIEILRKEVRRLEGDLAAAKHATEAAEYKAANDFAKLQDANRDIAELRKKHKKLGKDFEKVAHCDFASAVDAFSTPGMMKKHKPDG